MRDSLEQSAAPVKREASEDGSLVMVVGDDGPDVLETLPIPVGPPGSMCLDHSTRIPRARFVAAARSDVPDLASDIEALASDLQEAREEIERLKRLLPETGVDPYASPGTIGGHSGPFGCGNRSCRVCFG